MSKSTNDGLTRSCTGYLIAWPMATVGVKGLRMALGLLYQKSGTRFSFYRKLERYIATKKWENFDDRWNRFYRAMHFSAKRGIAIACRLSVCPSVTLVDCDHIGWNSSKLISPLVSLGCSLFATPTWRVCSKGNTPKFGPKVTPLLIWASETFDRKLQPNGYR